MPRIHFASLAIVVTTALLALAPICGNGDRKATLPESTATIVGTTAVAPAPILTPAPTTTPAPTHTPEPTVTGEPTASPTPPDDEPASSFPFSPPTSDADPMILSGTTWIDSAPAGREVLAFVDDHECGRGHTFHFNDEPTDIIGSYTLIAASDAMQPGCGVPGAIVVITIDGHPINRDVPWKPGGYSRRLVVGPDFGLYTGRVSFHSQSTPRFVVVPYVGDVECGRQILGEELAGDTSYGVVVLSDEAQSGCGRDGVDVTLVLRIAGADDTVLAVVPWQATRAVRVAEVDLPGEVPTDPEP